MSKKLPLPEKPDIEELVDFLPRLYAPGFTAIDRWRGGTTNEAGVITISWPEYNETVKAFFRSASKECWTDFEYDPAIAGPRVRDPAYIRTASLAHLQTLITFCVRGERFCDGFWAGTIEEGHIKNILERLKELLNVIK